MYRDDQDAMDATTNPAAWKNGRRFQSHRDITVDDLAAACVKAAQLCEPGPGADPVRSAAALVRMFGPTRAQRTAEHYKGRHTEGSREAVFYDQVARAIERGVVEAKGVGRG